MYLRENKIYFIGEGIVSVLIVCFTFKLYLYNKILYDIQEKYSNQIQKALMVASDPYYFKYLISGILFITLLVVYTIFIILKPYIGIDRWIILIINLVLLIILLIVFWNPIITTIAILLLLAGGISIAIGY